jgi:transposase-like protein
MDNKMTCPRCGASDRQNKHTANPSGSARFRCRRCGKTYTPQPTKYQYTEEERSQAIKSYYECKSGRAVGRLMKMDKSNVVRWIKERTAAMPEPDIMTAENTSEPVDVIELDEMFHFVKKKK